MNLTEAKSYLSKYKSKKFREYQEDAVNFILKSDKKFCFLEAPTGAGKSLVAMVAGVAMGGVTYSVHSKVLQNQIVQDFPEARALFGRANYPCNAIRGLTCADCFHTPGSPCREKGKWNKDLLMMEDPTCIYDVTKNEVLATKLRILNYDYLLAELNYVGRFRDSTYGFNIIDEGDILESTLINFVTLTFTDRILKKIGLEHYASELKKSSKNEDALLNTWQCFAVTAKIRIEQIIKQLNDEIKQGANLFGEIPASHKKIEEEIEELGSLRGKVILFLDNVDKSWVMDSDQAGKYIFRPLWMTEQLANKFLWNYSKRWVLMSASFLPINIEAKRLGIPLDQIDYKCLSSTFPIERRPIHLESIANLTGKTMEEEVPKLCVRIKEIINEHPNVKGLIHGVSYKLSQAIMDRVDSKRLITHESHNRQDVLQEFMNSSEPLILVSPSMERGISLEAELCRFIIVAKSPYLYLGDKIVSKRVYSSKLGQEWYVATMLLTVLQATGRGMRSAEDFCESYVLDAQFIKAFHKKMSFMPKWWKEAIVVW